MVTTDRPHPWLGTKIDRGLQVSTFIYVVALCRRAFLEKGAVIYQRSLCEQATILQSPRPGAEFVVNASQLDTPAGPNTHIPLLML